MIIDTHTHYIDGDWLCAGTLSAEQMVETQDALGIQEMWISSTGALADDFVFYNRNMAKALKPYASRFKMFATASPYFQQKAVDEIRRCLEDEGFWGIKVHYWMQGGTVHMRSSAQILELAIQYKVPVLFHDGTPPTSDTLQIAYLADLYPEAKIILGHAGMYDSVDSAIEACNTHTNLYLCMSCSTIRGAQKILNNARPGRILFGSDYGAAETRDICTDRLETVRLASRDDAQCRMVYYDNAAALLKELGAPG